MCKAQHHSNISKNTVKYSVYACNTILPIYLSSRRKSNNIDFNKFM